MLLSVVLVRPAGMGTNSNSRRPIAFPRRICCVRSSPCCFARGASRLSRVRTRAPPPPCLSFHGQQSVTPWTTMSPKIESKRTSTSTQRSRARCRLVCGSSSSPAVPRGVVADPPNAGAGFAVVATWRGATADVRVLVCYQLYQRAVRISRGGEVNAPWPIF